MQAVCPDTDSGDDQNGREALKLVTLALTAAVALALSAGVASARPMHHHRHHVVHHHHHMMHHHHHMHR